jgi:23S rRNA pseudouridine1911/1915/1917 synthase
MNKSNNKVEFQVEDSCNGLRLDQFLSKQFKDRSRSSLQRLVKSDHVFVNDKICKVPKTKIHTNDLVSITIPEEKNFEPVAEDFNIPIIYEDDDILVLNKPAGMVVHPAAGNWSGTVVNALLGKDNVPMQELVEAGDDPQRPGIVHRLDKDTSGCLIIAKNSIAKFKLNAMFSERNIEKIYAALCYGIPERESEKIITRIGRHPIDRKKMAVLENDGGKLAISSYKLISSGVIDNFPAAFLSVRILTGRTHQIRVHLSSIKLPIIGDTVYGGKQRIEAPRQMLHAWKLKFIHPITDEPLELEAPFPDDFKRVKDAIY